jgi:SAM-dependent methyltransferase
MHEILDHLRQGAFVLDLGSKEGSFRAKDYPHLRSLAVDLTMPASKETALTFVQADAAILPFRSRSFDAVILNHSLEHFARLKPALQELGRVLKADGALYVAVPDASTFCDRLYRRIFRNRGGHLNLFSNQTEIQQMVSWYTGLPPAGVRALCASFTFLNDRATSPSAERLRLTRLPERLLLIIVRGLRLLDHAFGLRLTVYGWAFYFGNLGQPVDENLRRNICVRCGQAHPSQRLTEIGRVRQKWFIQSFSCPSCGANNPFAAD